MGRPEAIAAPGDLRVPERHKLDEVLKYTSDEGRQQFINELLDALGVAEETNDLATVQYVLNAWWVSGLFSTHPDYERALEAATNVNDDELYTAKEIGELLGVV